MIRQFAIFDPSGTQVGTTQLIEAPQDTATERHIELPADASSSDAWSLNTAGELIRLDAAAEQLKSDIAFALQALTKERNLRINAAVPFPVQDSGKTVWLHWGGFGDVENRTELDAWVKANNPAADDPLPFDPDQPASTSSNQMYWAVAAYADGFAAAKAERFAVGKFDLTGARWQALNKGRNSWRLAHYAAAAEIAKRIQAGDPAQPSAEEWPQDLEAWLAANPTAHRA